MNNLFISGVVLCSLIITGCSDNSSTPDNPVTQEPALRAVNIPGAVILNLQSAPSCKNGICPGLGNSFYLPAINALSVNTGGGVFFKSTKLGDCATLSKVKHNFRGFKVADSMENFVKNTMSEADLSGTYKTGVLTAKGTAQSMTGSSSDITKTFHSTSMDIMSVTHSIDFEQSSKCFSENNIDPDFLTRFQSLAKIDTSKAANVSNPASWSPYVQFLQDQGSHIMMQQQIGSRFQQWESSTSTDSDITNTLKAKACAEVEGISASGGWSAKGCAAYSSEERKKALKTSSTSQRIILGGTEETRAALTSEVNKTNLDKFINSAEQGNEAIRFIFKPIWDLLFQVYRPLCAAGKPGTKACENLQRAVNLQAAYDGWIAVGCTEEKDGRGKVMQTMAKSGTDSMGINTYECNLSKTGCRSNNDCHLGGAGSVCYCYGPGCIDTGSKISGTSMLRNKVRGNKSGSYSSGVNNSCYYKFIAHCNCETSWSGGLPARTIYQQ